VKERWKRVQGERHSRLGQANASSYEDALVTTQADNVSIGIRKKGEPLHRRRLGIACDNVRGPTDQAHITLFEVVDFASRQDHAAPATKHCHEFDPVDRGKRQAPVAGSFEASASCAAGA
jgi:hypothetical protein